MYDPDIGSFYYGPGHPMKPHRVRMAHSLIMHSGIYDKLDCYLPARAQKEDMVAFHNADYVHLLSDTNPALAQQLRMYNMHDDCPVFEGLWEYNQIAAGGTLGCAVKLNKGEADIAINWAGGLHHAKKGESAGFCYVNDIVLGILELLKYHQRVLYIDIDVHHGDGVEEAFLTTDRVLTLSFHKFGDMFFPGTGDIVNVGHGPGKYYSVNVPLKDGASDTSYQLMFKPIVNRIMEVYQPEVVVFQAGADSLAHDRLGEFNLSSKGHASCIEHMKQFNVPLLLLGGGGYTIKNVARCWAFETGVSVGHDIGTQAPFSDYYEYFGPEYSIEVVSDPSVKDQNDEAYRSMILEKVMHHLSYVQHSPSVAFHERPPDTPDVTLALPSVEDGHEVVMGVSRPPQQMWKSPIKD